MKQAGLNGYVYKFSVDYVIDNGNIIDIHKFLMKLRGIKWCLDLLQKCLLYYCIMWLA